MRECIVIAHNIRSTHNVGAIFRTCEGFGVSTIILSGYTPYPDLGLTTSQKTYHTMKNSDRVQPWHIWQDTRLPHERAKITAQIHKTALGAEALVPYAHYPTLEQWFAINAASDDPFPVYALEQTTDSINLRDFDPPERMALLLGEEVHGVEPRYLEQCTGILEIPMVGQKESFNVSVATGIALYALTT